MKARLIIPLVALAVALVAPTAARADYYISQRKAESFARFDAVDRYRDLYGIASPAASCRPQGRSHPERGYIYHRWTCGWGAASDEGFAGGQLRIIGSSTSRDHFYSKVTRGIRFE